MIDFTLLAYFIRKPCALCRLPQQVQEYLHACFTAGIPCKQVVEGLHQQGYVWARRWHVYKHRKHLRIFLMQAGSSLQQVQQVQLQLAKARLEAIRLARTKEELAQAVVEGIQQFVSPDVYAQIAAIIESCDSEPEPEP